MLSPEKRLVISLLVLVGVFVFGAAGYLVVDDEPHRTVGDAVYMTVVTLSTVGFKEAWKLSPKDRIWTITVIIFGIASVSVAFTSLLTLFVSGDLRSYRERRKMKSTIDELRGHVILCGHGRMGSVVAHELTEQKIPLVVIDNNKDGEEALHAAGISYIIGDATDEDVLARAGLSSARALVLCLPSDADNVFVTMSAHTLVPELMIIARGEQPTTGAMLERAGASRVIFTHAVGAKRICNILTRPNVVDFVDVMSRGVDLEMDEYVVVAESGLVGRSIGDSLVRRKTGAIVVAIKRADGETIYTPDPEVVLGAGDALIIVGPVGVSERLHRLRDGG